MPRVVVVEKVYETPSARERAVVLWVSRHPPLAAQIAELEAKLGPIEVRQASGTVPSAEHVVDLARWLGARYVVPVLPLSFIAKLAEAARAQGFEILLAKMRNVAVVRGEEEVAGLVAERPDRRTAVAYADGTVRVFEFEGFERLIRVELVTEPL